MALVPFSTTGTLAGLGSLSQPALTLNTFQPISKMAITPTTPTMSPVYILRFPVQNRLLRAY